MGFDGLREIIFARTQYFLKGDLSFVLEGDGTEFLDYFQGGWIREKGIFQVSDCLNCCHFPCGIVKNPRESIQHRVGGLF